MEKEEEKKAASRNILENKCSKDVNAAQDLMEILPFQPQ